MSKSNRSTVLSEDNKTKLKQLSKEKHNLRIDRYISGISKESENSEKATASPQAV